MNFNQYPKSPLVLFLLREKQTYNLSSFTFITFKVLLECDFIAMNNNCQIAWLVSAIMWQKFC